MTVTNPPAQPWGDEIQTIWVDGLAIESRATLRVVGSKPLMIVSNADIAVRGTIDVSSKWAPEANDSDEGTGTEPSGGNGGAGSAGTERHGAAGGNADGGGGGAGFIVVYHGDPVVASGAIMSPPPHTQQ